MGSATAEKLKKLKNGSLTLPQKKAKNTKNARAAERAGHLGRLRSIRLLIRKTPPRRQHCQSRISNSLFIVS